MGGVKGSDETDSLVNQPPADPVRQGRDGRYRSSLLRDTSCGRGLLAFYSSSARPNPANAADRRNTSHEELSPGERDGATSDNPRMTAS